MKGKKQARTCLCQWKKALLLQQMFQKVEHARVKHQQFIRNRDLAFDFGVDCRATMFWSLGIWCRDAAPVQSHCRAPRLAVLLPRENENMAERSGRSGGHPHGPRKQKQAPPWRFDRRHLQVAPHTRSAAGAPIQTPLKECFAQSVLHVWATAVLMKKERERGTEKYRISEKIPQNHPGVSQKENNALNAEAQQTCAWKVYLKCGENSKQKNRFR